MEVKIELKENDRQNLTNWVELKMKSRFDEICQQLRDIFSNIGDIDMDYKIKIEVGV